jgi:N-glycosylase/DNA lyase
MTQHDELVLAFHNYLKESAEFENKGVKAAATRARKALQELNRLTTQRRKEIQNKKNEL